MNHVEEEMNPDFVPRAISLKDTRCAEDQLVNEQNEYFEDDEEDFDIEDDRSDEYDQKVSFDHSIPFPRSITHTVSTLLLKVTLL